MENQENTNDENKTDSSTEPKETTKRGNHDRRIANYLDSSKPILLLLQTDSAIKNPLAEKGYKAERIQAGQNLLNAADAAFNARIKAITLQKTGTLLLDEQERAARQSYTDFREIARGEFPARADRTALHLAGRVAQDIDDFIRHAADSYEAARKEAYVSVLSPFGFSEEELAGHLAALKKLDEDAKAHRNVIKSASAATKSRNQNYTAFKRWMGRFRRVSKIVFRDKPELAKKLDF